MRAPRAARFLAATLVAVLGSTTFGTAASAREPERNRLMFDDTLFVDDVTCAFPFEERVTGRIDITTFFDRAGNPARLHVNISARIEGLNPATGQTFEAVQANLYSTDLSTGERTTAGLRFRAHVPGEGSLLIDAGRLVVSSEGDITFEAGPHQLVNGDVQAFCDYLEGSVN